MAEANAQPTPDNHSSAAPAGGHQPTSGAVGTGPVEITCGPLLNYRHTSNADSKPIWHGSVLIVAEPGATLQPRLQYGESQSGVVLQDEHATNINSAGPANGIAKDAHEGERRTVDGLRLFADPRKTFWRFDLDIPLGPREARWEYTLLDVDLTNRHSPSPTRSFVLPAASESMRIMFHSCNGFSVGTDVDDWNGCVLWSDVLRMHAQKPIHVMLGGGDQIYNDGVRVEGPLKQWTSIGNPVKRRDYPFNEKLRADCDQYYFDNYVNWYSTEPFATANGQIPQVNIWDDHDIIDGFGSYTDHFMRCPVFRGIGGVSFKYYCLFQHHIPPPPSTYTTSATKGEGGAGTTHAPDQKQVEETHIATVKDEPCYIVGKKPGPYVEEHSRSMYSRLGAHIAFVGIDARLERTRHQVNYPETYDLIFNRLETELRAANGAIKHLILLLGVPIAYPRLVWLENLFTSPLMAPVRLLNKRFGVAGELFNKFDGQVDLLDDLDDHYTAKHHKRERRELLLRLQRLAAAHSVRVTILGGDVHLCAAGRFYSKPKLGIAAERDPRFMVNVISSAITNKPPPTAVANLLARRNKIHRMDHYTHETLMYLFDKNPGSIKRTADSNHATMPSRNYALITEARALPAAGSNGAAVVPGAGAAAPGGAAVNGAEADGADGAAGACGAAPATTKAAATDVPAAAGSKRTDGHQALHAGEDGAGTKHMVASGLHSGALPGGLDVSYRVEIDQHDREGRTEGYGLSIPMLQDPIKLPEPHHHLHR